MTLSAEEESLSSERISGLRFRQCTKASLPRFFADPSFDQGGDRGPSL